MLLFLGPRVVEDVSGGQELEGGPEEGGEAGDNEAGEEEDDEAVAAAPTWPRRSANTSILTTGNERTEAALIAAKNQVRVRSVERARVRGAPSLCPRSPPISPTKRSRVCENSAKSSGQSEVHVR